MHGPWRRTTTIVGMIADVVVLAAALLAAPAPAPAHHSRLKPDAPKHCDSCTSWNAPLEPFRVYGNTYYVGVAGLSSVLLTSDDGLILLDGGLSQSAPLIDANIRKLGFRTEDVRLIVNSHAHYDHAGGIAALQRLSGATVAASASGARAIERGEPVPDDPQFRFGRKANRFPRVNNVRVVADGEVLRVGALAITAHLTPGHTPGSTTWTWRSCEGERCLDVVYADSLNAVSAPGYKFSGDATHGSLEETFRKSMATIAALPCDVLLAVHPGFAGLDEKLARRQAGAAENPFIDPSACRTYASEAGQRLDRRLQEERAPETPSKSRR
jgi:metallo-beta-lactamase class B